MGHEAWGLRGTLRVSAPSPPLMPHARAPCLILMPALHVRARHEQLLIQVDRVSIGHPGNEVDGGTFDRLVDFRVEMIIGESVYEFEMFRVQHLGLFIFS